MKIQKVTLKEAVSHEVEGEFEMIYTNEKTHPAFLTNAALKRGRDLGLIEGSLVGELAKLQDFERMTSGDETDLELLENFDDTKMIQVIYLAFIGANKSSGLSFDEFIDLYHGDFSETITLYIQLISDSMTKDGNNFAAGLKNGTAASKKK
ncbi:hypothetical protein [Sporosarcina sp. E16_8]|uniref:hypothetical protein n=1 Tax=Sporosarcina sp. E16_8 TaxID=2789295 RepID=UPI001A9197F7|nr:hypothetical protein [Sporosarcina sp. E16_8]MBO0586456.1 hypothetical protein [Sporosarcina sp. E16_8]